MKKTYHGDIKTIKTGDESDGIEIRYFHRTKTVSVTGWYDHIVCMEVTDLTLSEFLTRLGITMDDCNSALSDN